MVSRNVRQEINFQVACPLSGIRIGNLAPIPVHRISLALCVNEALYGTCRIHGIRLFVRSHAVVAEIMKNSVVVAMIGTDGKRKEVQHGA
jgi:hypothetical protein